ncbi:MAG: CHAT domain-containing tetratricopeptide repeat protein, partial [Bacteroidota bacterium]
MEFFRTEAFIFEQVGQFKTALQYYEKAHVYYLKAPKRTPFVAVTLFMGMGNIYTRLGEHEQAQSTLQYGVEMAREGENKGFLSELLVSLAICYMDMEKYADAEAVYLEAADLGTLDELNQGLLLLNRGNMRMTPEQEMFDPESGRAMLAQARKAFERARAKVADEEVDHHMGFLELSLGDLLGWEGEIEQQIAQYGDAFKAYQRAYGTQKRREFGKVLNPLGDAYLKRGEIEKAIRTQQRALAQVLDEYHFEALDDLPAPAFLYPENVIVDALFSLAKAHEARFQALKSIDSSAHSALQTALRCHELIGMVEDSTQQLYLARKPKLALAKRRHQRIEHALHLCFQWWQSARDPAAFHKAFYISEKGSATVFREALQENRRLQAMAESGGENLLAEIARFQRRLEGFDELIAADTENILRTREARLQTLMRYGELKKRWRQENPLGYKIELENRPVALEPLQKTLQEKQQAMLKYFVGEEESYVLVIDSEKVEMIPMGRLSDADSIVGALRDAVQEFEKVIDEKAQEKAANRFVSASKKLYDLLVAPVVERGYDQFSRWVIVPDGALFQFPFAALLREAPTDVMDFSSYRSLDKALTTAFSATVYQLQCTDETPVLKGTYLGMAPMHFGGELGDLPNSGDLVELGRSIFGGTVRLDVAATREAFLGLAGQYRVVLLNTHGIGYPSLDRLLDSHLYFAGWGGAEQDSAKLTLGDLYVNRYPIHAELLVLQGCETAFGPVAPGEGMSGLAEGFFLSGCAGVVATQWPVISKTTEGLTEGFFMQLAKGLPRDVALRNARREFLAERVGKETAFPYFWAGMNVYGNPAPISDLPRIQAQESGGMSFS